MPNPDNEQRNKLSAVLALPANMVSFTDCPRTGDTIFHGVTLMSEGTWTDSLNKKPLKYTSSEIAKMRFEKMPFKAQHDIYGELAITNEIGIIENAKLSLNPAMWKGDVRIFPTALGKDIATLIKRKQITDISPEFFFDGIEHTDSGDNTPTGITFMGAATVRRGACRVCTFNEGVAQMADAKFSKEHMKEVLTDMKSHPDMMDDDMKSMMRGMMGGDKKAMNSGIDKMSEEIKNSAGSPGGTVAELKQDSESTTITELEAQLADAMKVKGQDINVLTAQLEEVQKIKVNKLMAENESLKAKNIELDTMNKQLVAALSKIDHDGRVKELQRQIHELSAAPVYHTTVSAALTGYQARAAIDTDNEFSPVSSRDLE